MNTVGKLSTLTYFAFHKGKCCSAPSWVLDLRCCAWQQSSSFWLWLVSLVCIATEQSMWRLVFFTPLHHSSVDLWLVGFSNKWAKGFDGSSASI